MDPHFPLALCTKKRKKRDCVWCAANLTMKSIHFHDCRGIGVIPRESSGLVPPAPCTVPGLVDVQQCPGQVQRASKNNVTKFPALCWKYSRMMNWKAWQDAITRWLWWLCQETQDLEETWLSGLPCCIPVNVEAWVTIPAGRDRQGDSNKLGQIADSLHVKSNTAACSEDLKYFLHLVQCSDV